MVRLDSLLWQKMVTVNYHSWLLVAYQARAFVLELAIAWNFAIRLKLGGIRRHFCRQVQNSVLLQSGQDHILTALDKFKPKAGAIDFRLYVDGDFTGVADIQFWMEALTARPWLLTYGYSKSWQSFLDYKGIVPSNYKLNLSSGSKYGDSVKDKLKAFDYVRGEFIAVSVGHKVATQDHAKREHQAILRQVYAKKAYTCTGKCGDCTPIGHACGSDRFKGIDIIIAVH